MQDDHPSLETLARWLAGELEHEQVRMELAPHFLGNCPTCRRKQEEIERLLEASGHWNEAVAVIETREAPGLMDLLGEGTHVERMRRAEEIDALHTWGFCQHLLKKCREEVFANPLRAVETAHLAVRVAGHLGEAYHPDWVLDLEARAFAHLGNARRVLGELKAADDAFLQAAERLERSGTGDLRAEAEVASFLGSLRLDQRRWEEARTLVDRSLTLYQKSQDGHGAAKAFLQKAKILKLMGDVEGSIELLRTSDETIDPHREPRLYAYARQSLLTSLNLAGRSQEAECLLPGVRELYRAIAEPLDWLRLRWTEGEILQGLGRLDEAEAAYREVRQDFMVRNKSYDVALISLDLATVFASQGRTEELKRLAAELIAVFESQEIHREAMAALLLFQQACLEERATLELIREIAARLQEGRRGG